LGFTGCFDLWDGWTLGNVRMNMLLNFVVLRVHRIGVLHIRKTSSWFTLHTTKP
jgi:hypothetical protein